MDTTAPGIVTKLQTDFDSALEKVSEALKAEGFGVLTEINVKETLKKKLDVDFRPYRILGACNPSLAHRALTAAPEVGLLLPCNVTVEQLEDGQIQVSIINPLAMMGMMSHESLNSIAEEAHQRLSRVVTTLEAS